MSDPEPTVVIIDDDLDMREALSALVKSVGISVKVMASTAEFLRSPLPDGPTCLVVDVRLPGQSGLDFQRELVAAGVLVPMIFITAHGDIPMTVQAMRRGAIEFLTKPFRHQDLLDAIQLGLAQDRARRDDAKVLAVLRERFETLTPRQREIMAHVVRGLLNKQIAAEIGVSEVMVKVHRVHLMRKMQAKSVADLARMADKLYKQTVGESS